MDLSYIFKNYPLNSDSVEYNSSENDNYLYGGQLNESLKNIPHGGFPPIIKCKIVEETNDTDDTSSDEDIEKRGFDPAKKNIISIQDILERRRKISPFVPK